MNIAVIPARGGSKRIPKKNIRNFLGKPVIAYSIEAAISSEVFDRVLVSTDDEVIANVAKEFGAEVPFLRPDELADDYTGTNDVVVHAIKWCQINEVDIDYICCIYATAPFVSPEYLREGYALLHGSGKSYAFSVASFSSPILRAMKIDAEGGLDMFWPEYLNVRSQDMDEAYHDAGQFYWGKPEAFLEEIPLFSNASIPVILPRYLVQDIDTLEDWHRAELLYQSIALSQEN